MFFLPEILISSFTSLIFFSSFKFQLKCFFLQEAFPDILDQRRSPPLLYPRGAMCFALLLLILIAIHPSGGPTPTRPVFPPQGKLLEVRDCICRAGSEATGRARRLARGSPQHTRADYREGGAATDTRCLCVMSPPTVPSSHMKDLPAGYMFGHLSVAMGTRRGRRME